MAVGEESMPSCYSTVIPRLVISNSRWRVVFGLFKTVQDGAKFAILSPFSKKQSRFRKVGKVCQQAPCCRVFKAKSRLKTRKVD
mgnify:CR=1 FL=1